MPRADKCAFNFACLALFANVDDDCDDNDNDDNDDNDDCDDNDDDKDDDGPKNRATQKND